MRAPETLRPIQTKILTQGILYLTDTAADQGAPQLVPGLHHRFQGGSTGSATPTQHPEWR